jgi:hypothetical protein
MTIFRPDKARRTVNAAQKWRPELQHIRKSMVALTLAGAASAAGLVCTAAPALATPSSCHTATHATTPTGSYEAWCNGGTGYVRAVAYCGVTPSSAFQYIFGPWVGVLDGHSVAHCTSARPYVEGGFADY